MELSSKQDYYNIKFTIYKNKVEVGSAKTIIGYGHNIKGTYLDIQSIMRSDMPTRHQMESSCTKESGQAILQEYSISPGRSSSISNKETSVAFQS